MKLLFNIIFKKYYDIILCIFHPNRFFQVLFYNAKNVFQFYISIEIYLFF